MISLLDPSMLKREITIKGYSIRGFAEEIGISHSYLSQLLNEKKRPSAKTAKKISDGLDTEFHIFFIYCG